MVKKGMKVNDIFEDGGFSYRVDKVLEDGNYISTRVNASEKKVEVKTDEIDEQKAEINETEKEVKLTKTDINRMAKDDLVKLANENGIEVTEEISGAAIKKQLIEKLGL